MIVFRAKDVGVVIRRLRQERSRSQDVLSGFAGIARSHLSAIETGKKQPNLETVWRIANALDMEPHTLVVLFEEEMRR